jgi:hypothetical protein
LKDLLISHKDENGVAPIVTILPHPSVLPRGEKGQLVSFGGRELKVRVYG